METTKRQFKLFSPRRQQLFSFYGQWTVSIAWTILSKLWFGLKLRIWFGLGWIRSAVPWSPVWILLKMDKEPPLSPFKSTTRSITPQSTKVRFDCNQSVKFWTSRWNFKPREFQFLQLQVQIFHRLIIGELQLFKKKSSIFFQHYRQS